MEIGNRITQKLASLKTSKAAHSAFGVNIFASKNKNIDLPSSNSVGMSQVNYNAPLPYTKIGEMSIPGVSNKASVFKLSNGQKVVIMPNEGKTKVSTSYAVGSLNETDDIRGISHFIEHNLFNGSRDLPSGEYDNQLSKMGGYTNAYTTYGKTQYYLTTQLLHDNSLEEAIRLNSLQTQYPTFPEIELEKEKEPVKQEIDMCNDNPANRTEMTMLKNLLGIPSEAGDILIGSKDKINALNRDTVLDYYNTWYTPDNAITVITGDVDVDETMQLVSKYFNKKPDLSKIQNRKKTEFKLTDKPVRNDFVQKNAQSATISIGFAIDENTPNADLDKIEFVSTLMASPNSEISQMLDKYDVKFSLSQMDTYVGENSPKVLEAIFTVPDDKNCEEVLKTIYAGITNCINNPPAQDEIDRLIKNMNYHRKDDLDNSENINEALMYMAQTNRPDMFSEKEKNISSITSKDFSDIVKKYIDLNKVSICVAHPEKPETSSKVSFGKKVDIAAKAGELADSINDKVLANNLHLTGVPVDNGANNYINMHFDTLYNPNLYQSHLDVLTELLNRGSAFRNQNDYLNACYGFQMDPKFDVSAQGIEVLSDFNTQNPIETCALLEEVLLNPNFTPQEFELAKAKVKDRYLARQKNPIDKIYSSIYPNNKNLAPNEEQLAALDSLTLEDARNIYNSMLYNSQASVVYSCHKDNIQNVENTLIPQLQQNLPAFRQYVRGLNSDINLYHPNQTEQIFTQTEENAQANIVQAYSYKRVENVQDMAKIELLSEILGDGMNSRLFKDLRNDKKIAYHVDGYASNLFDNGIMFFDIQTSTDKNFDKEANPENVNIALKGFKDNIDRVKTENVTVEELEIAKNKLKSTLLDIDGNQRKILCANKYLSSLYGKDYSKAYLEAIDKVNVEDIKAAANYVFKDAPRTSIVASVSTLKELNLPINK